MPATTLRKRNEGSMKQVVKQIWLTLLLVLTTAIAAQAYTITIVPHPNATITASKTVASQGDNIIVTVSPNTGYAVDNIFVDVFADAGQASSRRRTPQIQNGVAVTKLSEGKFQFTMPDYDVEVSASISAIPLTDITPAVITLSAESFTYNGSQQTPSVTSVKLDGKTLVSGTDYIVSKVASGTDVGTYSVVISGIGLYKNTATTSYTITPRVLTESMVSLSDSQFDYNGNVQKPTVTVSDMVGGVNLLKSDYYDITMPESRNKGDYPVIVMAKGNYTGLVTKVYSINGVSATNFSITLSATSFAYDGTAHQPVVTVKHGNRTLTQGASADYTLSYMNNVNAGTATVVVTGQNNYAEQQEKTFTITPRALLAEHVTLSATQFTYNGETQRPEVTVKDGTLLQESDYTLEMPISKNVGDYELQVVGKNNYSGTVKKSFSIEKQDISNAQIILNELANNVYSGTPKTPSILGVEINGENIPRTGYDVSYANHVNAGTATVTVTGKGNYKGSVSTTFEILPKPVSSEMMTFAPATFIYNGVAQKPSITVKDNEITLQEGNDYSLVNEGGVNIGTYSATIQGKGNYTGSATKDYAIVAMDATQLDVILQYSTVVYNGKEQKPDVVVKHGTTVLDADSYTVGYADNRNVGTASVTVMGKGNYAGSQTKSFTITPKPLANDMLILSESSFVYNGQNQKPVAWVNDGTTRLEETRDYSVTNEGGTNAGVYTVTVVGQGNYMGSISQQFNITAKPFDAAMIFLSEENFVFNGSVQKPEVTVKNGDVTLVEKTDFTMLNDGGTGIGNYTVSITGIGNYTGTAEKQFSIVAKDAATFAVTLASTQLVYNGKAQKPELTVMDGNSQLKENLHYTAAYRDNKNVGTATVTVTGIGNYSGTKSQTFVIEPKPMAETMIALSATSFTYNNRLQKPEVSVEDEDALTENDFTVVNEGGIDAGNYTLTVKGRSNYTGVVSLDYTINPLSLETATVVLNELVNRTYDGKEKKPTIHEVIVDDLDVPSRGYTVRYDNNINAGTATVVITGKGNFKDETTATFTIDRKSLAADMLLLSASELVYNGVQQAPEIEVRDGETTLQEDADYTLTNNGGTNIGTYTVTISGLGNYCGNVEKQFDIIAKDAVTFAVSFITPTVVYNGEEQTPAPEVYDGTQQLVPGTDYTTAYRDNRNVGIATLTVTGMGNYSGLTEQTFEILPKQITNDMITLSVDTFTYNGQLQKPEVSVSDGTALTENDYTVENEGGINVGEYEVVVMGSGNYTGETTVHYSIDALSLQTAVVSLDELTDSVYNGVEKEPTVSKVMVGELEVPDDSYSVRYSNNINAGEGLVILSGEGNFAGEATATFRIAPKAMDETMLTLSDTLFVYDGELHAPDAIVTDGDSLLTENVDYRLMNTGGQNAALYTVTIEGLGNYEGVVEKQYRIAPKSTDSLTLAITVEKMEYCGAELEPRPIVMDSLVQLTENVDFTVAYINNINVGTATVTVNGMGNYSGSKSVDFTITPRLLTDTMVTVLPNTLVYNGQVQVPNVIVSDADHITDSDYSIETEGGINVGQYSLTVVGQGNYTGTVIKSFAITPALVSHVAVNDVVEPSVGDQLCLSATFDGEGVAAIDTLYWQLADDSLFVSADSIAAPSSVYAVTLVLEADTNHLFSSATTATVNGMEATAAVWNADSTQLTVSYTFAPTLAQFVIPMTETVGEDVSYESAISFLLTVIDEPMKGVRIDRVLIPDSLSGQQLQVYIPSIALPENDIYTILEVKSGAFEGHHNISDIYLPDTEELIYLHEHALRLYSDSDSVQCTATLHTPLALLDNYALMPELEEHYQAGKVTAKATAKNRYWTFSSGVDVVLPTDVRAFIARQKSDTEVEIVELESYDLSIGGTQVIKAGNGILFSCKPKSNPLGLNESGSANGGTFNIQVFPHRLASGSDVIINDQKDYGHQNLLEPVVEPTHFDSDGYYLLSNNVFYAISTNDPTAMVPACKAVLHLPSASLSRSLTIVVSESTGVEAVEALEGETHVQWFDMNGRRISKPTKKGIYLMRTPADKMGKKVEIR